MITVVLDTNVLVSGFATALGPPGRILSAWHNQAFALMVSEHILNEVESTLTKPYFVQRLTVEDRANGLLLLREESIVVDATAMVSGVATHSEDDLVLATAVSGQADYLVTGDAQLQRIGAYQGVIILSPRAFLALLTP